MLGLLIFFFMVLLNFVCLDNPPYWDDILGVHNQAIWLAKHNFNVTQLWRPEHWDSNVYKFGIIPYFYGVLYCLFSAHIVHIMGHLFNMGCLALAFGVSYSILRKFKVMSYIAFLWCVAVICEPVMAGRVTALGQECPVLCAAILSIYFLVDKRYGLGCLFIFLAMLCKMTAGILAAAFLLWLLIDICLAGKNWKERLKAYSLYLGCGLILIAFFLFTRFGQPAGEMYGSRILWDGWFINMSYQFPVLLPIQALALLLVICVALWRLVIIIKTKSLLKLTEKDKISLLLLILIGAFWTSYALYHCSLPRYSSFIVFPMYIFIALNTFTEKKQLTAFLAVILLSIGALNVNGRFYLPLISRQLRSGEYLERSREYLNDLWENEAACRLLETKYFNRPIVAKWPFVQMLTIPEMGYVSKALPNVYCACPPINYAKVKLYRVSDKMPDNTLIPIWFQLTGILDDIWSLVVSGT